jgi:polyketide cyclase/dehydrase/lipid transport protein
MNGIFVTGINRLSLNNGEQQKDLVMKVEHSIEILAPAETVWAVTTDIDNWPDWTPTVENAARQDDGPFDVGSYARIKQPGSAVAIWEVLSLTPGKGFIWETHTRGIHFIATHDTTVTATGCCNLLALELKGVLAFLLWPFAKRQALKTLTTENEGLKRFCEEKTARET